jgi:steroid delta-isomerase-like uncharacterized protein
MAPSRPKQGPPVKRAAEEGWLMRYLSTIVAPLGISAMLLVGQAVAQVESPAPPECPIKTAVENTVIARAWHDDVINRRNPAILQDILASDVVHHAAGGYPKVMDATGIAAMMAEFLTAFPDLRYTFDQFIVQDDYVVERYTAVGTQQGQLGDLPPSGRTATWTGINIFRIKCGRIVEVWSEVDAVSRRQQLMGATSANSPR